MLAITELLEPSPVPLWRIVKQAGVNQVVSLLDGAEQHWRWPKAGAQHLVPGRYVAPAPGERPWERPALKRLQDQYREYGLEVSVIEDTAPMDDVRLGRPDRDEQIEWFCAQLKAMGELGIPTLCYNWVAITSWARTSISVPRRGGAFPAGTTTRSCARPHLWWSLGA